MSDSIVYILHRTDRCGDDEPPTNLRKENFAMYNEMRKLAEKWHAGQFRDGADSGVPYIEHPKAVVRNLLDWGEPEISPAIGIAWGHDLLEDTATTGEEILEASDETVLAGILLLTRKDGTGKREYLQKVALLGNREELLVKMSDRIQNSRDFARGEGPRRAFLYLHEAECIYGAVQKLSKDPVVANAIAAWQALDEEVRSEARRDMIRGCLLGGAIGDALGAPVEFMSKEAIQRQYGKNGVTGYTEFADGTGAITDDTQMTLFTAEGSLRATVRNFEKGICDPVTVMRHAYWRWLKTQGGHTPEGPKFEDTLRSGWLIQEKALFVRRAPGNTCLSALEDRRAPEKADNESKGCGSVMRMAPVGLFLEPELAYEYGCRFSALTHGHRTGITSGGAFAMLIAELLSGKPLNNALDLVLDFLDREKDASETAAALRKARTAKDISELGEGWIAEEALAIGVYCALKHTWEFKAGVLEAVNITGDSDSTGAITGNILGVMNGENGIPADWISHLREQDIVSKIADDLWTRFEDDVDGHVTDVWWNKYPGF